MPVDFDRAGSFQQGTRILSENPLEELWSYVARLGSPEWLNAAVTTTNPTLSVQQIADYSAVRVRQAVEFRDAARNLSLLTSPLPLYYSFLNLLRAFMAIEASRPSAKAHGLHFEAGPDLLKSKAKITNGTFSDYLTTLGVAHQSGSILSLDECLSLVPELADDYTSMRRGDSLAVPVMVQVKGSGNVWLHFQIDTNLESDLRQNWTTWFPKLTNECELEASGATLHLKSPMNVEQASDFCVQHLETHLTLIGYAKWYAIKQVTPNSGLPRAAHYLAAMFILGSIVRYEPEVMLDVAKPGSELGWFLGRFLKVAERFYPNLMLNWLQGSNTFF